MWFDRYGPRRVVATMSLLAIAGAILLSRASDATSLIAARGLVGLGCAASFMSAVLLCSRWFPGARYTTVLSWVFAASNIGTLGAATPLAWASATIGWRGAFLALAGVTVVIAAAFLLVVRDYPPGKAPPRPARPETFREVVDGLLAVWRTPGLVPVLAMHTFAYAAMVTVLGVWAGPYLHDVHGLDAVGRGNVMLAMGAAQIVGLLVCGPMDRILDSRKKVVLIGAGLAVSTLAALGAIAGPSFHLAVFLMIALPFVSSYSIAIVAQGRALFPDALAGRGVTTVNMAQVIGSAALPAATGYILGGLSSGAGAAPETAYRVVFGFVAASLASGLLVYLRSRDSRPSKL
ncbi:MAG: MFS transporter [Rhodospirillales bacterium]|nr:MAG: MFS transporter [Rhodospirillales bacterium]